MRNLAFLLLFASMPVFAAAVASPFAADGSGTWTWLPNGKASGYFKGTWGGGSIAINACGIFTNVATEFNSGAAAQTSDVVIPIDIGGPGWVRPVLSGSTAPSLAYEIRPASQSTEFSPDAFDCPN